LLVYEIGWHCVFMAEQELNVLIFYFVQKTNIIYL
jgi:hypothetical protein